MAAWVDLAALHDPAAGLRPPASWGDGVNSNLAMLGGAAVSRITTSQSTSSTTFTNLTTVGPIVTIDTGTKALAIFGAQVDPGIIMSIEVSGASSIAPNYDDSLVYNASTGGFWTGLGYWDTLTPGTNIFTVKYLTDGSTRSFLRRYLAIIPLV